MKKKQYGFLTVFFEENDKGEKVIKRLRFLGEKKNEYITEGDIAIDVVPPDSVGSEEIKDESVDKQDLKKDIQDTLDKVEDASTIGEDAVSKMVADAIKNASGSTEGKG